MSPGCFRSASVKRFEIGVVHVDIACGVFADFEKDFVAEGMCEGCCCDVCVF
jgi:hypothetical protein